MNCIVKLSNNDSWYFYYDASNGICFSRLNSHGEMGESGVLSADSPDDFDVICDRENNIHMCCQNNGGDIVYYRYKNKIWNKTVLLKSKSNTTNKKHFHLFSINGWINILYVLEYRGKNMLTHHIPERNNGEPEIVDYIGTSYTASTDGYGNIHVFYDSEISSAFGYKTYLWSQKKWSDFKQATHYDNCSTMLSTFDIDNNLKVVASKNKEIHFMTEENDTIISTGERPVIFTIKNSYIIQWAYRSRIYSAISTDGGISFEKSGEYPLNKRIVPELYRVSFINKDVKAEYCYGYRSGDRIILLELEGISVGNNETSESYTEELTETINDNDSAYTEAEVTQPDYTSMLNKITTLLNIANDSLFKIEKRVGSCEAKLTNIEDIIKELPEGSSKKRKINRV